MSERSKLEQVLEFLLAEDNERAEELLHEYVVETARAEYERILDEDEVVEETEEDEDEEVDEAFDHADPEQDFVSDVEEADEDIEADMSEDDDEMDMDMDMDMGDEDEGEEGEEEGEEDLEGKVDELADELEDLRAEFEQLLAAEEGEDHMMGDADEAEMDADAEMEEESVEYDLDEDFDEEDEVVEEATKLSDKVGDQPMTGKSLKGSEADSSESPFTKAPKHTKVASQGSPVKGKDGGEGNRGAGAKDHTPTNNIKVEPKKA